MNTPSLTHYISHRGANRLAPENTLAAIQLAYQHGFKWVEFDIQLTQDGHLVLMHDQTLQRMTGYQSCIQDMSLTTIKLLTVHAHNCDAKIPTLISVLDWMHAHDMHANIEIKALTKSNNPIDELTGQPFDTALHQRTAIALAECLQALSYSPSVIVSSFCMHALDTFHQVAPNTPIGVLLDCQPDMLNSKLSRIEKHLHDFDAFSLHVNANLITETTSKTLRCLSDKILSYTVNQPEQANRFFQWGISSVFTDDHTLPCAAKALS